MKKKKIALLILLFMALLCLPVNAATKTKKITLKNNKIVTAYAIKGIHKTVKFNISGTSYKWTSSNKKVATVSKKGVTTIRSKGNTTITATKKGKKFKCKIIVENPSLSKTLLVLNTGESSKLFVTGTKQNVKWKSSNSNIVLVSSSGEVYGVKEGTAKIKATVGNAKTLVCEVAVRKASTPAINPTPTPAPIPTAAPVIIITATPTPIPTPTVAPVIPVTPSGTISQNNALKEAQSYLRVSAFSREGLIDQLEYEGFSTADATYGVDNSGANWFEQAEKSAKSYLKSSSFSYTGLIKQLEFEKFTSEQARYGVDNCGADWYEQAVKTAASYMRSSSFSHSRLVDQLIFEGFTADQAEYGVTQNGL